QCLYYFFFQAEDGIRDDLVTGVQTCALPISAPTAQHRFGMRMARAAEGAALARGGRRRTHTPAVRRGLVPRMASAAASTDGTSKIGRASWRERGWMEEGGEGRNRKESVSIMR